jgi:hypothetical protein
VSGGRLAETEIIAKFNGSILEQTDRPAATNRGAAFEDVIGYFYGMQFGRAEPPLLPIGARCSR